MKSLKNEFPLKRLVNHNLSTSNVLPVVDQNKTLVSTEFDLNQDSLEEINKLKRIISKKEEIILQNNKENEALKEKV